MSKLKRLLGALSLVALFIFSSCVDDEVAPEVTALRQAQVDLLNADVAFRNSETAFINATVAYQEAQTAGQLIANAGAQEGVDNTIANNLLALELAAANNATNLEIAALALQTAQDNLAEYLATAGLEQAAEYLATWDMIVNGGAAAAVVADITIPTGGIAGLTRDLSALQADAALLDMLFQEGMTAPQDVLIARAEADVAKAEASEVSTKAELEAGAALVAGADDPAAPLEAALIALAEDTLAQQVRIDSIDDAITALSAITTVAQATIDRFEDDVTNGQAYLDAVESESWKSDSLAILSADTTLYFAYADSLQVVYNEYFALVDDFVTELEAAEDAYDAADNAKSDAESTPEVQALVTEVQEAFSALVVAEREFKAIITAGDTPSAADTVAFVNARDAWDGLAEDDMFDAPAPGTIANIIDDVTEDVNTLNPDDLTGDFFEIKAVTDAFTDLGGTGGALDEYNKAVDPTLLDEALLEAAIALATIQDQYVAARDLFENLADAIKDINDLDYVGQLPLTFAVLDITTDGQFDAMADDLTVAGYVLDDASSSATNGSEGLSYTLTGNNIPEVDDTNTTFDPGVVYTWSTGTDDLADIADLIDELSGDIEDLQEEIEEFGPFVEPYLEEYEAALATKKAAGDSVAAAKIPLEFARFEAQDAKSAISTMMSDLKDQITAVNNPTEVTLDDSGDPESSPIVIFTIGDESFSSIAELSTWLNTNAESTATDAEDAVFVAQKGLSDAQSGLMTVENEQVAIAAEIAAKETQISVLQSLADAYQALLLAALAG